ncbi:MAG: hexameric tyrosine-coordinated heme protein [Pseudomonadota bacterium]
MPARPVAAATAAQSSSFPTTLVTETAEEGFALAIKLSRLGVKAVQPDPAVLRRLRPVYATNADSLIASSQVIAVHFQTIAAANDYWRDGAGD